MAVIYTKRFALRPITEDDAPVFARLCNDETIARNTARIPHPYTIENAVAFTRYAVSAVAEKHEYHFAVCEDDEIIGRCGVMRDNDDWEIGYWVAAAARGNGVATEIAGATTQFAIEALQAKIVTAGYFFDNPASAKVLEKLGFRATGESREIFSLGRDCTVETPQMTLRATDFLRPEAVRINTAR
jgi:RimJ/RimL family protein N-acetyltransferase